MVVPYLWNKYAVRKVTRDTIMRPTDYNRTDWNLVKFRDSLNAVKDARQRSPGRTIILFDSGKTTILE